MLYNNCKSVVWGGGGGGGVGGGRRQQNEYISLPDLVVRLGHRNNFF